MWGSTGFWFCSSASGSLRRSCFWNKVGGVEAQGGASGFLLLLLLLLPTHQGQERAQPRTAPVPHGTMSPRDGQVGFSGGADEVWWAVGEEESGLGPERRAPAGRRNPAKQGGTPGAE